MKAVPSTQKVILEMEYDNEATSPEIMDFSWKVEKFRPGSGLFDVDGNPNTENIGLHCKLTCNFAFPLRHFTWRHQPCWAINTGPKSQHGGRYQTGILLWNRDTRMLPTSLASRKDDAELFLVRYNKWNNRECFAYTVYEAIDAKVVHEKPEWKEKKCISVCTSFIGEDDFLRAVRRALKEYDVVKITGDARHLLEKSES